MAARVLTVGDVHGRDFTADEALAWLIWRDMDRLGDTMQALFEDAVDEGEPPATMSIDSAMALLLRGLRSGDVVALAMRAGHYRPAPGSWFAGAKLQHREDGFTIFSANGDALPVLIDAGSLIKFSHLATGSERTVERVPREETASFEFDFSTTDKFLGLFDAAAYFASRGAGGSLTLTEIESAAAELFRTIDVSEVEVTAVDRSGIRVALPRIFELLDPDIDSWGSGRTHLVSWATQPDDPRGDAITLRGHQGEPDFTKARIETSALSELVAKMPVPSEDDWVWHYVSNGKKRSAEPLLLKKMKLRYEAGQMLLNRSDEFEFLASWVSDPKGRPQQMGWPTVKDRSIQQSVKDEFARLRGSS